MIAVIAVLGCLAGESLTSMALTDMGIARKTPRAAAGADADTKQVNFRLPRATWQRLVAAAGVFGKPQWRIVTEALTAYFDSLPPAKRRALDEAIVYRQRP